MMELIAVTNRMASAKHDGNNSFEEVGDRDNYTDMSYDFVQFKTFVKP